jgi:4-alpha-glucanotransferase
MTPLSKHKRASGILLHITSLPSAFGIGDLGPQSYHFADLLVANKQGCWSILPLTPTRQADGNSPYQTSSAFAGNPLLVSPERLFEEGLLPRKPDPPKVTLANRVDYAASYKYKAVILNQAYVTYQKTKAGASDFEAFCTKNRDWLNDYALYNALRNSLDVPWQFWPTNLRKRDSAALQRKHDSLKDAVEQEKFAQFLFFRQWSSLKTYCHKLGIRIVGDMPFYVAHDSADVWSHPQLFNLYGNGKPRYVGGVPPDYFSTTGQLWGNPVYDWQKLEATGFEWWINRIRHNLALFDVLRLDHFRGFVAYWQVGGRARTALHGHWVKTPSEAFFGALKTAFPSMPFIAEDLGYIDAPVREAIRRWRLPGMKVLLFAFDGDPKNLHLPKNHPQNAVVYTGTHDTNTARGWYCQEASNKEKNNLNMAVAHKVTEKDVSGELVRLALASRADLCILPLQDVLGLGGQARMNHPSHALHNWEWRVTFAHLKSPRLADLAALTVECNRAPKRQR